MAATLSERTMSRPRKRTRPAKPPYEAENQPESVAGPSHPRPTPFKSSRVPSKTFGRPRLFAPFRALGLVSDHVPFAMFVHSPKGALATPRVQIVTSVGRSWMMWDAATMKLLFVGERRAIMGTVRS